MTGVSNRQNKRNSVPRMVKMFLEGKYRKMREEVEQDAERRHSFEEKLGDPSLSDEERKRVAREVGRRSTPSHIEHVRESRRTSSKSTNNVPLWK